jgi:hypothetical protein
MGMGVEDAAVEEAVMKGDSTPEAPGLKRF